MRAILGAAAAAILSLLVAAPAMADQAYVRDRTGDVLQGRVNEDGGYGYQSDITEGDVIATQFLHNPRSVIVTSRFRRLDAVGNYHGYYLRLQSGRGTYREVDVEAFPGRWSGRVTVTNHAGERVRCQVTHRIDYARNTVRVSVPRACLGRPTYVRGTAANAWTRPDTSDRTQPDLVMLDNPHNTSHLANTWTRWIKRG